MRNLIEQITEVMQNAHSVNLSSYDGGFLQDTIRLRQTAAKIPSIEAYLEYLTENAEEREAFSISLSVTYSEFFRNPLTFGILEQCILPWIIEDHRQSNREIRVWSAGCAAGQEAWSVAILLDELIRKQRDPLPFRIFATDISQSELDRAQFGEYHYSMMGNMRMRHVEEYTTKHGDCYTLIDQIMEHVEFSLYDLLDDDTNSPPSSIYGDFDLIFCSNVMLYYGHKQQALILRKLRKCMVANGYLITDSTERRMVEDAGGFLPVSPAAPVFYRVRKK